MEFLIGLALIVTGWFLRPVLEPQINRFWVKVKKRPVIKTSFHKDMKTLGEIKSPLRFINQLPRYPSNSFREDVRDRLNLIHEKADTIKSKQFDEIKQKLIDYSNKVEHMHMSISLKEVDRLLIRNQEGGLLAFDLIDEIERKITAERLKKKA